MKHLFIAITIFFTALTYGCAGASPSIVSSFFSPVSESVKWYRSATAEKAIIGNNEHIVSTIFTVLQETSIHIDSAGRTEEDIVLIECLFPGENTIKISISVIPLLPGIAKVKIITRRGLFQPAPDISRVLLEQVEEMTRHPG